MHVCKDVQSFDWFQTHNSPYNIQALRFFKRILADLKVYTYINSRIRQELGLREGYHFGWVNTAVSCLTEE